MGSLTRALVTAVALGAPTLASAQNTIAEYLVEENCPTTIEEAKNINEDQCIRAIRDSTHVISIMLSEFITKTKYSSIGGFSAKLYNDELLDNCIHPAEALEEKEYSSSRKHLKATADFVELCIPVIRKADGKFDISLKSSTAEIMANTIVNQMECLTGKECIEITSVDPFTINIK
jgi:hypothetical protein